MSKEISYLIMDKKGWLVRVVETHKEGVVRHIADFGGHREVMFSGDGKGWSVPLDNLKGVKGLVMMIRGSADHQWEISKIWREELHGGIMSSKWTDYGLVYEA